MVQNEYDISKLMVEMAVLQTKFDGLKSDISELKEQLDSRASREMFDSYSDLTTEELKSIKSNQITIPKFITSNPKFFFTLLAILIFLISGFNIYKILQPLL